jgi:hypothetical protein
MAIICNCRRVIGRVSPGGDPYAEYRVVKARKWDCPSCGLDRKRKLVEMCGAARVTRIVTLTFPQPQLVILPSLDWLVPAGFERCNPADHWSPHATDGTIRWLTVGSCEWCCRRVSRQLRLWRDRLRRRWPGFQYLHVKEQHKSGALHLHLAVFGVPAYITRTSRAGLFVKGSWAEVGGGFVDVGRHGVDDTGAAAGWYVGKYLAKRQDHPMAKGFRRWTRSQLFAPEILMVPRWSPADDWADPAAPIKLGGWLDGHGVERRWRWWPDGADGAGHVRLDPRTLNCPHRPSGRSLAALQLARWASLSTLPTPATAPAVVEAPAPSELLVLF